MYKLIKCFICVIFCLLLTGCGQAKQNTPENQANLVRPTPETENIDWLDPNTTQEQEVQLTQTLAEAPQPIQAESEDTDLNLESIMQGPSLASAASTASLGYSVPTEIQSNYENCGPASLASVFRYHGVNDSQSQIASKTTNGNGAGTSDIADYARSRGFNQTREISRDFHGDSLDALKSRVADRPQIVVVGPQSGSKIIYDYPQTLNPDKNWGGNFFRSSPNNHFVVVQSFTPEGNPVLMDPARAELGRVVADRDWFDRHWIHTVDVS